MGSDNGAPLDSNVAYIVEKFADAIAALPEAIANAIEKLSCKGDAPLCQRRFTDLEEDLEEASRAIKGHNGTPGMVTVITTLGIQMEALKKSHEKLQATLWGIVMLVLSSVILAIIQLVVK